MLLTRRRLAHARLKSGLGTTGSPDPKFSEFDFPAPLEATSPAKAEYMRTPANGSPSPAAKQLLVDG
jgi:hypothetical protein